MCFYNKRAVPPSPGTEKEPPWLDHLAAPLAGLALRVKKSFARYMDRVSRKLSPQRLRTALVAFSLCGAGISGYLILSSVRERGEAFSTLPIESFHIPKNVGRDGKDPLPSNGAPDGRVLQRIHAFRQYMDSLRKAGHPLHDHLHSSRPGLMDSLQTVERMYPSTLLK